MVHSVAQEEPASSLESRYRTPQACNGHRHERSMRRTRVLEHHHHSPDNSRWSLVQLDAWDEHHLSLIAGHDHHHTIKLEDWDDKERNLGCLGPV